VRKKIIRAGYGPVCCVTDREGCVENEQRRNGGSIRQSANRADGAGSALIEVEEEGAPVVFLLLDDHLHYTADRKESV
jgi:hypothetical protein